MVNCFVLSDSPISTGVDYPYLISQYLLPRQKQMHYLITKTKTYYCSFLSFIIIRPFTDKTR